MICRTHGMQANHHTTVSMETSVKVNLLYVVVYFCTFMKYFKFPIFFLIKYNILMNL
jgi:hypothetical protein